jgi:predicted MFS family arabinose efflux permease
MSLDRPRIAVAAAGFCAFLDLYPTQSLLSVLADEFHADKAAVGLTVSATTLAVALTAPLAGLIADRWGRKRVIVGGALLMAIPTALAGTAGTIDQLVLWRFLQGLFLPAVFAVAAAHIAEEWPAAEAADLTGVYVAGMVLGGFSGRFLAAMVGEAVGWRYGFPALAGINLVGVVLIALWLPPDRAKRADGAPRVAVLAQLGSHLGNRKLLATCAMGFMILFSMIAVFTYINFKLSAPPFNLGLAALGSLFVVYLFGMPAAPASGPLLHRFGRRRVMAGAVMVSLLGLAATLSDHLVVVLIGLVLFAIGIFIAQPLSIGFAGTVTRDAKALAVGLYVGCYYVGGSLGGVAPAAVWTDLGWPGCAALVAMVQLLLLGLAMIVFAPASTPVPVPAPVPAPTVLTPLLADDEAPAFSV